jgi:hypothetical protein
MRTAFLGFMMVACGCSGDSGYSGYEIHFECSSLNPDVCPSGAECPTVPLGQGGCEDLPGYFGHATIPVELGRPLGCEVELPYGNAAYNNAQVECTCKLVEGAAVWVCPL